MNKKGKMNGTKIGIFIGVFAIIAILGMVSYATFFGKSQSATGQVNTPSGTQVSPGGFIAPAYTYSAYDAFSTTAIGGTDQIKLNGNKPVTSLASPTAGQALTYWKSNTSYMCEVAGPETVQYGPQSVQTTCYANGTTTLAVYDKVGRVTLTNGGGANNITIGANGNANLEFSYQANAKQSNFPFGGCVAVDYPTTMSSFSVSGALSDLTPCPYTWTFTPATSGNAYRTFAIPAGFDKDGVGDYKVMNVGMLASASDPSGTVTITMQPANYYVTNAGEIVLGIEKDKNQDTTKTFATSRTTSFVIE